MSIIMLLALVAAQAGAASEPASAQTECVKPTLVKRQGMSATELNGIMQRAQDYVTCMSATIETQRKLADEAFAKAKAAADRNNAMVTEVNGFVSEVKAYQNERASE